jgi:hypothetical protein
MVLDGRPRESTSPGIADLQPADVRAASAASWEPSAAAALAAQPVEAR